MKAKFFVLDFINYVFAVAIGVFVFYYFMRGDRLQYAMKFFMEISQFSVFALLFLIFFKKNGHDVLLIKLREKQENYFQIVKYLERKDEILDWAYLISLPLMIFALAFFLDEVNKVDMLQAFFVFYIAAIAHKFFFKKRDQERDFLTTADKLADEIIVYSLPMIIYGIAMAVKSVNIVDTFQALAVIFVSYVWHFFYFKPRR